MQTLLLCVSFPRKHVLSLMLLYRAMYIERPVSVTFRILQTTPGHLNRAYFRSFGPRSRTMYFLTTS